MFNKCGKFPAMSGPPAYIHLKDVAIPKAKYNPIPVPYHYREEVKKALWNDVEKVIITPVSISALTDWCSTIVITAKKNGKPRRTMNYQHLTSQCKQETHHTSPLSIKVPWRCPWCNGYRRRKWTRRHEFKSWMRLIAFHIALIPLGKVWIQLFSLQLWINSRTD